MLGIVLPVAVPAAVAAADIVGAIATVHVRIAIKIIVVIDCDVVIASPTRAPSPTSTPSGSHSHSHSERKRHACGVVSWWRVGNWRVGIRGRAINYRRVIAGNVNDFWAGLFNDDDRFVFYNLGFYLHLLIGLEISRVFRFRPHALHGLHHVTLLRQEGVPEVCGPLNVVSQALHHVGQSGHGLNTGVPRLLGYGIDEGLVLQVLVSFQPLLKLDDFQGIRGGG
jgi:hypothetical protein